MSGAKCGQCGLMNFGGAGQCRRCDTPLFKQNQLAASEGGDEKPQTKKKIMKSVLRIFALAGFVIFLWYASLIGTSEPVVFDQKKIVDSAISVLERRGFDDEVFVLRHMVRYRATDNWLNRKAGHDSAFASTNFPFEVVTLYPAFFEQTKDDVERAAVLLHEAYHLFGHGELAAVEGTWRDKKKLGWTKELYGNTPVWTSAKESTQELAPQLLQCGPDHKADCAE
jgi:hypothetical protein